MAPHRGIVVTGIGVVSPIGIGKEPFWSALREGRSGIRRLEMAVDPTAPPPFGGQVADFDPKQYVRPRKSLKVMNRDIQLAFAAADLACVDAGLREKPVDPERLGVLFGAGVMPCELDEITPACRRSAVDGTVDLHLWGQRAMGELFPLWMLKYLPNMPACHIGIGQDARGPNNTITLGDVSSLSAIAEAVRGLDRGNADAMIVGGVGSRLHPLEWARGRINGLSQRSGEPEAASRPFDAQRDGVVNGEGASAVILESEERAQARGATVLGRVLGHGAVFAPHRNGDVPVTNAVRRAILTALQDANLSAADVGVVVAHGLSTVDDDRMEAQAIRATLGDVPVTAPKSSFGYLGTAAGALEIAVALLAIQHTQIPPTLNYEHPDPECPINLVHRQPAPLQKPVAIVLSHSRQGQAVAVVLGGA
ncbi:MAG: beta-ketoacyl-[acyl-carrier-protein] synthase family protein [Planctomycetaceae bacterium]|nr:beta-ketoacyl-[acyl-carrier-protein] synthase family protein [Planctomycetaceae bacterium]